jgi:uncharacterized protein YggL (DUF469 family)
MRQQKQLTHAEFDALDFELASTCQTTLTEQRYNEILDAMLPMLEEIPEAQASLTYSGKREWVERRRNRKTAA